MTTFRFSVNNWQIDLPAGAIAHQQTGEVKRLGEYQIKLLFCLAQHAGQTLSRDDLLTLVWERRVIGHNSLSNAIHALRAALEDDGKLQKIIKTIPKRGYLLEAEYCQRVEVPAEDPQPPTAPTSQQNAVAAVAENKARAASTGPLALRAPVASGLVHRIKKMPPALLLSALAGLLIILGSGWYASFINDADMVYQEQGKNRYSNIRTYQIALSSDKAGDKDMAQLNAVFQQFNPILINLDAGMTVYYHTTEQMLNYTFTIDTPCASKQLAMTLYHWRTDSQKLTDIIQRETKRVLNEMAPCKKP